MATVERLDVELTAHSAQFTRAMQQASAEVRKTADVVARSAEGVLKLDAAFGVAEKGAKAIGKAFSFVAANGGTAQFNEALERLQKNGAATQRALAETVTRSQALQVAMGNLARDADGATRVLQRLGSGVGDTVALASVAVGALVDTLQLWWSSLGAGLGRAVVAITDAAEAAFGVANVMNPFAEQLEDRFLTATRAARGVGAEIQQWGLSSARRQVDDLTQGWRDLVAVGSRVGLRDTSAAVAAPAPVAAGRGAGGGGGGASRDLAADAQAQALQDLTARGEILARQRETIPLLIQQATEQAAADTDARNREIAERSDQALQDLRERYAREAEVAAEGARRAAEEMQRQREVFVSAGVSAAQSFVGGITSFLNGGSWRDVLRGALGALSSVLAVAIPGAGGIAASGATSILGGLFHSGGVVRAHSGMGLTAGEVPIVAQSGEAVLSRSAVARLGGEQGVDALNAGGAPGRSVTFAPSISVSGNPDPEVLSRTLRRLLIEQRDDLTRTLAFRGVR